MNPLLAWSLETAAIWLFVGLVIGALAGYLATVLWMHHHRLTISTGGGFPDEVVYVVPRLSLWRRRRCYGNMRS